MNWPSRSPDLNIIEDVWNEMKWKMRGKNFDNKNDLWKEVRKQWLQISPDFINSLYAKLPDRIRAVLATNGRHSSPSLKVRILNTKEKKIFDKFQKIIQSRISQ